MISPKANEIKELYYKGAYTCYQSIIISKKENHGDYKNETLFGIVKEVEPWDACTPIQNNITDYIALAIRGGSPLCSFSTKVKNVRMFVL